MAEPADQSPKSLRDFAEEVIYAAVGVASLTKERTDELVDELSGRGKLTRDEARDLVDEVVGRWRGEAVRMGERASSSFAGLFKEMGLVTRRDYDELELRLAQLEHRLRLLEGTPQKTTGPGL
jgi:polyhydroxyalkanoate synthesis regulator phasin